MLSSEIYDIVIIGGGVTGLAAAMYAGRMKLKTILIGFPPGGTIATTDWIENYPGFISLSGKELADKIQAHAMQYEIKIVPDSVTAITRQEQIFIVQTAFSQYSSKTVIFATGARYRKLQVPGADKYENKGVHFCGLCDGPAYERKILAVVGGGDSAAKEALIVSQYAQKVYIIVRGNRLKAEPINAERVANSDKITVIYNTNVERIEGDATINKIILDQPYLQSKELEVQGIFIAIGSEPLSDLAKAIGVETNKKGEILINRNSETNIQGVYAAGDVTNTEFKQAITGVAEGTTAVYHAYKYVTGKYVSTCIDTEYLDCPASAEDDRPRPN